jgi:hypothetical protein
MKTLFLYTSLLSGFIRNPGGWVAEDRNMHGHHYPIENIIDELLGFIFPEIRMVFMKRLFVGLSPTPAH